LTREYHKEEKKMELGGTRRYGYQAYFLSEDIEDNMIKVKRGQDITAINSLEGEYYDFRVQGDMIEPFKELVRRSLNCWPDAHPALKELGDMLMHGEVLQDYYASRTDLKKKNAEGG
jgi:hypothetical protein